MEMVIPEDHVLGGWSVVHAGWLLSRFHVTSANGVTAFMAFPIEDEFVPSARRSTPWTARNRNASVSGAEAAG